MEKENKMPSEIDNDHKLQDGSIMEVQVIA